MTTLFSHPSYQDKVLSRKPSQHTLAHMGKLDNGLNAIAERLDAGSHPMDIFMPQQTAQSTIAPSPAERLIHDVHTSYVTPADYQKLESIPNVTPALLERHYAAIKQKDYQTGSPVEASIKRFGLLREIVDEVRTNVLFNWMKKAHELRKPYNPKNDGLYPIRLSNGKVLGITRIDDIGQSQSGEPYSSKQVYPFIDKDKSPKERAALYNQITCKPIKKVANLLESALIGQDGVFATKFIPKGTCIGVYGGVIFPNIPVTRLPQHESKLLGHLDTYLLYLMRAGQPIVPIDGDTIISKANTTFIYEDGQPVDQAPLSAFNTERVDFGVDLSNGLKTNIATLFTTKDIQPGEEIRFDYGYEPEDIKKKFRIQPANH